MSAALNTYHDRAMNSVSQSSIFVGRSRTSAGSAKKEQKTMSTIHGGSLADRISQECRYFNTGNRYTPGR